MTKVTKILWWILGGGKGSGQPTVFQKNDLPII